MRTWRAGIADDGAVVIPAVALNAAGLRVGDQVFERVEGGEVRLVSVQRVISRSQEIVRRYVASDQSLVDELIAERRRDSSRE